MQIEIEEDKKKILKIIIQILEKLEKNNFKITSENLLYNSYNFYLLTYQENYMDEYSFKFSVNKYIKENLCHIIEKYEVIDSNFLKELIIKNKINNF